MQNSQEFIACTKGVVRLYPGYCGTGCTGLTEVPGTGINVLQNQHKFGYGYESLTELPEVPGIVTRAFRTYRSSGYGYACPTELTEVPGTGITRVNAHPLGGEFDLKWST